LASALSAIIESGSKISPTRGSARELTGVRLEITNPRARLSRTETRGKPFSCLGELCWYLSARDDLQFIEYYIKRYAEDAEADGRIHGAYGRRIFAWDGASQWDRIVARLTERPDSRQNVIQIFDRTDLTAEYRDIPCTCTLQFLGRDGRLTLVTHMRSNDAFFGLPHDVFCFTMLQELMARSVGLQLGPYIHFAGSLHLYDAHIEEVGFFLNEGYQPTIPMPDMPPSDNDGSVQTLLEAEEAIRLRSVRSDPFVDRVPPYWADLIRLLETLSASKRGDSTRIKELAAVCSEVYRPFILGKA
jgi:thymidylate synthase